MAKPPSYENTETDNKHEGVYDHCYPPAQIDVAKIPPNNPRPNENKPTKHLFGNFSS